MLRFCFFIIYNLLIVPVIEIALYGGALFSQKFRARRNGIRHTWQQIQTVSHHAPHNNTKKTIWFHAASAGEFEQVKPVIEHLRTLRHDLHIIATFYSASGYEAHKTYPHCDILCFLPNDSWFAVHAFVRLAKIDCAVFSRYDLWWNMAHTLRKKNIPLLMINATINPDITRNTLLKTYHRLLYANCTAIYTAGDNETELFHALGLFSHIHTSADTRADRIIERVMAHQNDTHYAPLKQQNFTLIIGSSWHADEARIFPAVQALRAEGFALTLIIVPHEPTADHIREIFHTFPHAHRLSAIEPNLTAELHLGDQPTIIVDSIGKLLRLYAIADGVYIGGGFGFCVHSVLEPAGYGLALACGPHIALARDAVALHDQHALQIIETADDVVQWLKTLLTEPQKKARAEKTALAYIESKRGVSRHIAQEILLQI